jgi:hypothetical protein
MTDCYVLRWTPPPPARDDRLYLLNLGPPPEVKWTTCQHCARRFSREVAHALHSGFPDWAIIRIRAKKKEPNANR